MKKSKLFIAAFLLTANCLLPSVSQAQYTKLFDFDGSNGYAPTGDLFSDGTFLYGMTSNAGTNYYGNIFKIKPDGTGYINLHYFNNTAGKHPSGSLISDGTYLYGMTNVGGANNYGVLFKIKPNGTGFAVVMDFNNTGGFPYGSLIFDGNFLYGMTETGGDGTIFKIKPDGTGYVQLYQFINNVAGTPYGSLISDGTFLYGMTSIGGGAGTVCGSAGCGVVFKIKLDGTGYANILSFNGTNGSTPFGSLISDGTFLYGMTQYGGTHDEGTIFKIKPDGTSYAQLIDFDSLNGKRPYYSSLILQGTFLYGMTKEGGTNNYNGGVLFKIKPDGTGYAKLINFNGTNGNSPDGSLISDGTFLYGMTQAGGSNGYGTIFKYKSAVCTGTAVTFNQSLTICAGQSVTVGTHTHTANGTYKDTLTAANACDSIVTTNLSINNACVTTPTISVSGTTLTSSSATGNQWYLNGNIITGATSQTYNATQNGSYTVKANGSATSAPHIVTTVTGIVENSFFTTINIFPNPTSGIIYLQMNKVENIQIKITDILGNSVYQSNSTSPHCQIDLSSQANGIYFISIQTNEGIVNKKIVISH